MASLHLTDYAFLRPPSLKQTVLTNDDDDDDSIMLEARITLDGSFSNEQVQ